MDGRPVAPETRIEVSVMVRPRRPLAELEGRLASGAPPLTREAYAAAYGADPADLARVATLAEAHGLQVLESDAARRTVRLAGRAADISAAFGVELREAAGYRAATAEPRLPPELRDVVEGVFGLDTRPAARQRDPTPAPLEQPPRPGHGEPR